MVVDRGRGRSRRLARLALGWAATRLPPRREPARRADRRAAAADAVRAMPLPGLPAVCRGYRRRARPRSTGVRQAARRRSRALAELLDREPRPLDPALRHPRPRSSPWIDEERCIGCARCLPACPVDAIVGAPRFMHTVIRDAVHGLRALHRALPRRLHRIAAARRDHCRCAACIGPRDARSCHVSAPGWLLKPHKRPALRDPIRIVTAPAASPCSRWTRARAARPPRSSRPATRRHRHGDRTRSGRLCRHVARPGLGPGPLDRAPGDRLGQRLAARAS